MNPTTAATDMPDTEVIEQILSRHNRQLPGGLIPLLEDIQRTYGYLPEEALRRVSEATEQPLADIYGVATFYSAFSLERRGKHLAQICVGTACHVRGAPAVAEAFEKSLGVSCGCTTKDGEFTTKTVNCLGACALGPVVVVDGHYFSNVKPADVPATIEKTQVGFDAVSVEGDERLFPISVRCPRCNHSLMDSTHTIDDRPSIRLTGAFNGKHTSIRLSSLYGSHKFDCKYEISRGLVVKFFCRRCHARLVGAATCPECQGPMAPMFVDGGGLLQVCCRAGCKGHRLDMGDNVLD